MNTLAIWLIRQYKTWISPLLFFSCRFHPTCSDYARQCFERYSFRKAFHLSLSRLLKCHPFHPGGMDPVP